MFEILDFCRKQNFWHTYLCTEKYTCENQINNLLPLRFLHSHQKVSRVIPARGINKFARAKKKLILWKAGHIYSPALFIKTSTVPHASTACRCENSLSLPQEENSIKLTHQLAEVTFAYSFNHCFNIFFFRNISSKSQDLSTNCLNLQIAK